MNPIPVSPLSLRWSTDEVDARRSLDYWIDTVCDQFLELRVDTPLRSQFRASFECMPLGAVTFNVFRAERQHVFRTQSQIARCTEPTFILLQPRHGDVVFRQLGREVHVRPGECVLMNSAEPYEVVCPQAHIAAGLRMPDSWLRRWVPHPERHPAAVFSGARWNAALCAALASLEVDSCGQLALPGGVVADQMAALLALCLGPTAAGMRSGSLHEDLLRTLRDRLHEPDLSASKLAAEHHVSERTVYYGFAGAGTTLAETLVAMRLERARELLADRRYADMPVLDIAARCGFVDPSHFARRFRLRYGLAPAAYRRSAGRPALVWPLD